MVQMSTVWDRTTAFVSSALSVVVPIALILFALPLAIQLSLAPVMAQGAPFLRLIVMVVLWLIELTGTLTLIVLALGATPHPGEALHAAVARLPAVVGITVLLGIVAAIIAMPMGFAMIASHVTMAALRAGDTAAAAAITPGVAVFIGLYGLAYIVLIVWATARLLVIEPVILAERRGLGAIGRAFALTRGLTWRIIGVMLLYAIVSTIAVLAARMVFGSVFGLIAGGDATVTIGDVLTAIVVAIVSAGFKTVAALFIGKLYLAIVEQAERLAEPS